MLECLFLSFTCKYECSSHLHLYIKPPYGGGRMGLLLGVGVIFKRLVCMFECLFLACIFEYECSLHLHLYKKPAGTPYGALGGKMGVSLEGWVHIFEYLRYMEGSEADQLLAFERLYLQVGACLSQRFNQNTKQVTADQNS